mgnify:FL=1
MAIMPNIANKERIKAMKVKNITSRNGNKIANQFIVTDGEFEYFQSYNSVIAQRHISSGVVKLDVHYWDYSTTTGKYRNQFLGMDKKQTEKEIKAGRIDLINLN